jgi:hypothetical protein
MSPSRTTGRAESSSVALVRIARPQAARQCRAAGFLSRVEIGLESV